MQNPRDKLPWDGNLCSEHDITVILLISEQLWLLEYALHSTRSARILSLGEKGPGYVNILSLEGERPMYSTRSTHRQIMLAKEREVHDVLLLLKYVLIDSGQWERDISFRGTDTHQENIAPVNHSSFKTQMKYFWSSIKLLQLTMIIINE